ncbi:MAG: hypothetical protein U1A23_04775 [Candidatus Sungbacteria bacterium]|nr:hypothetical protein [bacterium]MDZ4286218.1 hypothetical protein [Candidatus Sungbacteria bacterium]
MDEKYREELKKQYHFSEWPRGKNMHADILLPDEIEGWRQVSKESLSDAYGKKLTTKYVYAKDATYRVAVTVFTRESADAADEDMLEIISGYMATSLPTCKSQGVDAGDVCFGTNDKMLSAALFVRDNIAVQVLNIDKGAVLIADLLKKIDSLIASQGMGVLA